MASLRRVLQSPWSPRWPRVDGQHFLEDPEVVVQGNRVLHLRYRCAVAEDLDAILRPIVDTNRFMALGTADSGDDVGVPRLVRPGLLPRSHLDFAAEQAALPEPHATSVDRDRDLRLAPAGWLGRVYMASAAAEVGDIEASLEVFNRRSEAHGLRAWSREEVAAAGEFRLYRATMSERFVLDDHDRRATRWTYE